MAIKFRTLRSGSGGNSSLLCAGQAGLLIDFAPGCQRDCRAVLREVKQTCAVAAVLVTHAHGDHVNRNSLKVLKEEGLAVRCHPQVRREIIERHGGEYAGIIRPFEGRLAIGDFTVGQVPVGHAPGCTTNAFIITAAACGREYKASVFTDLSGFTDRHIALALDSDLLCVEANHDLELFRTCGHPGSEFHLSNPRTAQFLHGICAHSRKQPGAVVLWHLSEDCNRPHLPVKEIEACFERNSFPVKFEIHVAPRSGPGALLVIK